MRLLKITLLTIIMVLGVNKINAQTETEIIGFWKTELSDERGGTEMLPIEFNKNGKLIVIGKDFGTWHYNNAAKTITIKSELKDINGVNKVEKLNEKQMVLLNTQNQKKLFELISLPNGQEYNNEITGKYILKKG